MSVSTSPSGRPFTYKGVKFIHEDGRWIVGVQENGIPSAIFGPFGTKVSSLQAAELSEAARRVGFRFTAPPPVEDVEEKKSSSTGAKRGRPVGSGIKKSNNIVGVATGAVAVIPVIKS